jgi:hypothetical protein
MLQLAVHEMIGAQNRSPNGPPGGVRLNFSAYGGCRVSGVACKTLNVAFVACRQFALPSSLVIFPVILRIFQKVVNYLSRPT